MKTIAILLALLFAPLSAQAAITWVSTVVDEDEQTVTVNFSGLPSDYEELQVMGSVGLVHPGTGSTEPIGIDSIGSYVWNTAGVAVEFSGSGEAAVNYIEYHYNDDWSWMQTYVDSYANEYDGTTSNQVDVDMPKMFFGTYVDTDGDVVHDGFDNCTLVANGVNEDWNQYDDDSDGFGNNCDCDFNQDDVILGDDITALYANWNSSSTLHDLDGDGIVGGTDLTICYALFNDPPGPAGDL